MSKKIVIIGNGISGTTAARWIRKLSDYEITMVSEETEHFFSRTALMYVYMGHMRKEDIKPYEDWFWDKNNINLIQDRVISIDFASQTVNLKSSKSSLPYDDLILALGSKYNKFGWPGQDLRGVGGLYHMQDLDYMESYSEDLSRAVVVGGGLIGIEMSEMFHSRGIPVTLLVREASYWNNVLPEEESKMISDHIRKNGIDLRLGVNLDQILDDGKGRAGSVTIKETGEKINCGFVGLTAGVSPNVAWLKETDLHVDRGIVVDGHLQTNIPNVFAIGDCAQIAEPVEGRKNIEAVWYTGRMMGETAAYNICGRPCSYNPGIWFNSAKFIDIEYQVYGDVPTKNPHGVSSLFWQHDDHGKSIRINYDSVSKAVIGFNLLGVRYRHEVCEKWILDKTSIEEVLQHLGLANFDPEFYKQYEPALVQLYNQQSGRDLKLKTKRSLNAVLAFLKK